MLFFHDSLHSGITGRMGLLTAVDEVVDFSAENGDPR